LASKAHRQKTTIKKRTLNPEFNETIQFLVPFKDLPKKTLEIGVYDYGLCIVRGLKVKICELKMLADTMTTLGELFFQRLHPGNVENNGSK
jgi:hypothetical protein